MNPLTNVRNIQKLNQTELQLGTVGKKSWHDQYKDSAWIFVGGLPYDLTEGDILCVFSQYGEIVNMNLVRDKGTGKSKGYGFICYEDQRSTVLAVDNLNSIKLIGRIIRVDHVENYKVPKEHGDEDEVTTKLRDEGCAPQIESSSSEEEEVLPLKKIKKEKDPDKKSKKKKKKEKKKKKAESSSEDEVSHDTRHPIRVKKEKHDAGYDQPMKSDGSRDQRERNGTPERDSGFRNGTNRQERGNDRGRNERQDGWQDRDRSESRRGDNRDERRDKGDFRRGDNRDDFRRADNRDEYRRGNREERFASNDFRQGDYRDDRQRDYQERDRYRRDDRNRDNYRDRYDSYRDRR